MESARYVILDFVVGLLLAWTYAAMRPRFGPGAKTAIYVAIAYWILGAILTSAYQQIGLMSTGLWLQYGLVWLVCFILASLTAGMLYKEEAAAA